MMERSAEVALARTAAPQSISQNATVMVMGRHGYENAATGKNGFVCIVQRSWTAEIDDPDFWNPKLRAPICFNPAAVRSFLPQTIKRTEWVLAGQSKAQMFEELKAALDKKELPKPEVGAMCYMMSKQGYLNDTCRALAPSPDVFSSTCRSDQLGCKPAWLTCHRTGRRSERTDRVYDSRWALVRRHSCSITAQVNTEGRTP